MILYQRTLSSFRTLIYDKENKRSVNLIYEDSYTIAVNNNDNITTEIKLHKITVPSKKGMVAGYVHVFCNGTETGKVALITEKNVKELSFTEKLKISIGSIMRKIF